MAKLLIVTLANESLPRGDSAGQSDAREPRKRRSRARARNAERKTGFTGPTRSKKTAPAAPRVRLLHSLMRQAVARDPARSSSDAFESPANNAVRQRAPPSLVSATC